MPSTDLLESPNTMYCILENISNDEIQHKKQMRKVLNIMVVEG